MEEGYFKLSQAESSFNLKTHEIFNNDLCTSYAFVERLKPIDDRAPFLHHDDPRLRKIWHLDINKCRANRLYFSDYDFPLFTVMDEPVVFKGDVSKPGLYYVETKAYFPLRGNGWYSQPVVEYCLSKGIIQENEIKHVVYAGLVIKKQYFKKMYM
jgi:hypothetical protein